MARQNILVTGSSGLIGASLCEALATQGHRLRRFDIADQTGGFGDVRVPQQLQRALQGCTGVIHLAAVSRVISGERDPQNCRDTNVTGTRNLLQQIQALPQPPWLIYASSREVYGQGLELPIREEAPLQPMNHYARSKLAAEQAVQAAMAAGLRASVLRFSTVYGSSADHADRVIPAFCRAALANRPLRVEGAENCLDITHVADVARAVLAVIERLSVGRVLAPMHLTTGRGTRLPDLAALVVQLANSHSTTTLAPPRSYDVARFAGDPARAAAQIGWQPQVPLSRGLAGLIAQLRSEMAAR